MQYRTLATMIAQNKMAEMRLSGQIPSVGQSKEELEFGYHKWKTITKVSGTEDAKLMRVDLDISREIESGELFRELDFTGFIADLK